jgi:hypothetical protein
MNNFVITQDNVEIIMNKARRLPWDDANEVFTIIKDLKPVRITSDGKEDDNQKELFKNKFSGTGDRNEKEKPKEVLPASVTADKNWGGDGTPVY